MKAYFSDTRFGKTGWLAVVSLRVILAFMIGERLASSQTALTESPRPLCRANHSSVPGLHPAGGLNSFLAIHRTWCMRPD